MYCLFFVYLLFLRWYVYYVFLCRFFVASSIRSLFLCSCICCRFIFTFKSLVLNLFSYLYFSTSCSILYSSIVFSLQIRYIFVYKFTVSFFIYLLCLFVHLLCLRLYINCTFVCTFVVSFIVYFLSLCLYICFVSSHFVCSFN